MTRALGPDLHEIILIYILFDYFLDLWTSFEILVDFFRVSSDRRDVSHENHKKLGDISAKVAPRRGETLENTKACFHVEAPKERPRDTQNLKKKRFSFVGARLMRRSLGVLLAPFWVRVGIRVARKSRKRSILQLCLTTSSSLNSWPSEKNCIFKLVDNFRAPAVV